MATFFGEVRDVSSRSAWWSDSENDEEDPKEKPIFQLSVQDQQHFDQIRSQCRRIYVTNVKSFSQNSVATIKVDRVKGVTGSASTVAWLSTVVGKDGQCCWLAINDKLLSFRIHLTVKVVDFLFENLLNGFSANYDIHIVSKDMSQSSHIKYLKSTFNSERLNQWEAEQKGKYPMSLLMAPETSRNEFELAVLEYCIIKKVDCILFILSATLDVGFIPTVILDSLNQFGAYQTNLII